MVKVQCENCGQIGYTAAPECLLCRCGGKHKVIPEDTPKQRVKLDKESQEFICRCKV